MTLKLYTKISTHPKKIVVWEPNKIGKFEILNPKNRLNLCCSKISEHPFPNPRVFTSTIYAPLISVFLGFSQLTILYCFTPYFCYFTPLYAALRPSTLLYATLRYFAVFRNIGQLERLEDNIKEIDFASLIREAADRTRWRGGIATITLQDYGID